MSAAGESHTFQGIKHHYKIAQSNGGWLGYAGSFDSDTVDKIAARAEVAFVEPDRKVYTKGIVTEKAGSWGLARISQQAKLSTGSAKKMYRYDDSAGEGVTAYVIDTGVLADHEEFEGRAIFGHNAVEGSSDTDKNGHGTHVSATIAGKTYGVAKKAKIVGVKVLGDDGTGSNSTVIAGLNWAADHAATEGDIKNSVANMSLGGSQSDALNSAVAAIIRLGMVVCVAAGNESTNASNSSPASEPTAITVGSTTDEDKMSYFSNYGTLVDIFAPGSNITSAWIDQTGQGRNNLTNTISGTSMATPHVVGLCAYLITLEGLKSPREVVQRLKQLAGRDLITGLIENSPNMLAFNGVSTEEL